MNKTITKTKTINIYLLTVEYNENQKAECQK